MVIQLTTPVELKQSGNMEDQWKRFKLYFTLYLQAKVPMKRQSGALFLTITGSDTLDVLTHFELTQPEEVNYKTVYYRNLMSTALRIK